MWLQLLLIIIIIIIIIIIKSKRYWRSTASRRYCGICVVFPHPVSPSMISTWWLSIALNKSSLNGKIGKLRRVSSIDIFFFSASVTAASFYNQSTSTNPGYSFHNRSTSTSWIFIPQSIHIHKSRIIFTVKAWEDDWRMWRHDHMYITV